MKVPAPASEPGLAGSHPATGSAPLGVDAGSAPAFAAAEALWREWNARINVISRKDEENIYAHHILHSLAIAEYLRLFYPEDFSQMTAEVCQVSQYSGHLAQNRPFLFQVSQKTGHLARSILDVGTGGGFPGIPLAMVLPAADFTLCDSIGKKVRVAQAVADGLELKNLRCVQSRVEELPGNWDWVVSRAVTSLENFYPWVRGRFNRSILYLKGGDIASEIAALQRRFKIPASKIRTWPIAPWIAGLSASAPAAPVAETAASVSLQEYYAEKYVIEIAS